MERNLEAVKNYVNFLHEHFGMHITIHSNGSLLTGITAALGELNIHSNPYCIYVKSVPEAWNECVSRQCKVAEHLNKNGCQSFFGSCYAGMGEYIVPVYEENTVYGFISVSGYRGDTEKMRRFGMRHMVDRDIIEKSFEKYLNPNIPEESFVNNIIMPICSMLLLELKRKPPEYYSKKDEVMNDALNYLHRNYSSAISLADVANHCHCSTRTFSRMFVRENGMTVGEYIEKLRMKKALALLTETALPIVEIAFLCGFGSANYFSSRFSRYYGESPAKARKNRQRYIE